ncbi:MAG: CocE/NonD family hydrolase [Ruminococcaceae bacterium]|nr:CocE/NonD family hydrolase [Oscillospiraceae bacterium]
MIKYHTYYEYVESDGVKLFTCIMLPEKEGKFPVVLVRAPYVDVFENEDENDVVVECAAQNKKWLKNGYAVVVQHCRGRGKSEGDCVPYINERKDGLNLLDFIRKQPFYNGTILLKGRSYLASVWYTIAPYADDIKGAILLNQDSERYNICYRNGFLKKALHGNWYVGMYKKKSHIKKNHTTDSFNLLPLLSFTKTVFGESVPDFDNMLKSPNPNDEFWKTPDGGVEAKDAMKNVKFPVLFETAFYDIYTGGVFDMWNKMEDKSKSALVVSPYDHGDRVNLDEGIEFPCGKRCEKFGEDYDVWWFDYVLGKRSEPPFKQGEVTYYRLFENVWKTDTFKKEENEIKLTLGNDEITYVYNPFDPPSFKGGLSCNFGGSVFQEAPNSRYDIISIYTEKFEKDTFVKGKMKAKLNVKSDCEDTCFYVRISIEKEKGDYGLRDDITSIIYQKGNYTPNEYVDLDFSFDEHAFLIKKGERLRIDISSADNAHYVRHTNNKGLYSTQTTARVAHNTVNLKDSFIVLSIE